MSAVYGANATKYRAGASGGNTIDAGEYNAPVFAIFDTYTAAGLVAGSTIAFPQLPDGAKIVDICLFWADMGAAGSTQVSVGDSASAARYVAATDVGTGIGSLSLQQDGKQAGFQYEIGTATGDNVILLTTAGAGFTGGKFSIIITYTYA